jgi:hypothetical protein
MYILHARNIAEGMPYLNTGYVFNPQEPHLGPPAYPPLVPALLAPVYRFSGLNLNAMKVEIVLLLLSALAVMYALFLRFLPPLWCGLLILLLAFNPNGYWSSRDEIASDIPFLLFLYLSLWLIDRAYLVEEPSIPYALIVGLAIYLACSTRMLAFVLFPSLLILEISRRRRLTAFAAIALGGAFVLIALQSLVIKTSSGFAGLFIFSPVWMVHNALCYARDLRVFWLNGYSRPLTMVVYSVVGMLLVYGLWKRGKAPLNILEIFGTLYLAILFLYSICGTYRYLYPVLPIYLMFALLGLRALMRESRVGKAIAVGVGVLVLFTYAAQFSKSSYGPFTEGLSDKNFIELCGYIRTHTQESDLFIFRKPRVLALLTRRHASTYSEKGDVGPYVDSIHANYIVTARVQHGDFSSEATVLQPYVDASSQRLQKVYENPTFSLYKVRQPSTSLSE